MFPRRVPVLDTELHVSENGLTDPQIIALTAAVNVLRPNFIDHSRKISVILFEKYPQYLPFFRKNPPDNYALHIHSKMVLEFYSRLIEFGLQNLDMYKQMLASFVHMHRRRGISYEDALNITTVYKEYLDFVLTRHRSETLITAMNIFFSAVANAFLDESLMV